MKELQLLHIEHWHNFLLAFIPLFIAIDVVGILPIFMSLVDGIEKPQKTKIVNQSVITALSVSIGFLALGKFVFSVLGDGFKYHSAGMHDSLCHGRCGAVLDNASRVFGGQTGNGDFSCPVRRCVRIWEASIPGNWLAWLQ